MFLVLLYFSFLFYLSFAQGGLVAIYGERWELGHKKRQHLFAATHSLWGVGGGGDIIQLSLFVFFLRCLEGDERFKSRK